MRCDSKAQLAVGNEIETLTTSRRRGKVKSIYEKHTHTIPKWLETSYYYELKLLSLTVMFKLEIAVVHGFLHAIF